MSMIGARVFRIALSGALVIHAELLAAPAFAASCLLERQGPEAKVLRVPTAATWDKAGSGLLGANTLYHFEDDRFWARPQSIKSLKEARIATLRFPGGELADNYDWEKNLLERPQDWPGEAPTKAESDARTDYRELLAHAAASDAQDVFFIVNVDGAFRARGDREQNLKLYAEKAARWVKAVKDMGARVRFWEIGNEPYLAGYPITAEEYARALNVFAREMRAADPSILIGAAGSGNFEGVGFADRLDLPQLEELRTRGRDDLCRGLSRSECNWKLRTSNPAPSGSRAWWPTLLAQARDSFDFAIVHRYDSIKLAAGFKRGGFMRTESLRELKVQLERAKGRAVLLALTEWNTPNEIRGERLSEVEHLLNVTMQIGNTIASGVEYAHYYPMRTPTGAHKPLLTNEGGLTPVGRLFGLLGDVLPGADVSQFLLDEEVYVLRTRRAGEDGYIVVNAGSAGMQLELKEVGTGQVRLSRIAGNPAGAALPAVGCEEKVSRAEARWVEVPKESITVLRVLR